MKHSLWQWKVVLSLLFVTFFLGATLTLPAQSWAAALSTVSGEINTINLEKRTINIKKADGTGVTLRVKSKTPVVRNGSRTNLNGLALRDSVTVRYVSLRMVAVKISATGPKVETVSGDVKDVAMGDGTITVGSQVVQVTASTKISRNGLVVSLSEITNKDSVVVHVAGDEARAAAAASAEDVVAEGPESGSIEGTISALSGNNVTITPDNGTDPVTIVANASTIIEKDGEAATVSALSVGFKVEAHFDPVSMAAFSIEAESGGDAEEAKVHGIVAAVDANAGLLRITPDGGGQDVTLTVTAATEIEVDDEEATLLELQVGMPVKANYEKSTLVATEIKGGSGEDEDENDDDALAKGLVAAVGENSITITPDDGSAEITLTVDTSTEIEVKGEDGTLAQIVPGDPIKAQYYVESLIAKEIKAGAEEEEDHDDAKTSGTVTAVDSTTVTIAPANGTAEITLTVASWTEIKVNDEDATIADIQAGDSITAEYDVDTLVAKELKVGDTGEEEEVETSGTVSEVTDTTVTVNPDDGGEPITLTVNSETDIEIDGEDGNIADIQVGDTIRADYDSVTLVANDIKVGHGGGGEEEDVTIEGTVAAVGSDSITIDPDSGSPVVLTVNASTEIEKNGEGAAIEDIIVGDQIRAEYDPNTLVASSLKVGHDDEFLMSVPADFNAPFPDGASRPGHSWLEPRRACGGS